MTSSYKFIVMHRVKLAWKLIKHGFKVLLNLSKREGDLLVTRHKSDNLFIDYMIHNPCETTS